MSRKKSFELDEKLLNKIISVAYGDSSVRDKLIVMRAAKQNEQVRNLLTSYKQTAAEVKQIREEVCPEDLIKKIDQNKLPAAKSSNGFLFDFYSIVFARPVISAATTFVLVAAIIIALFVNKPVQYNYKYSEAQIIDADKQARQAFAIVGKFFKETQVTLQNEILKDRVAQPINKGIGIVNNLFKGETK